MMSSLHMLAHASQRFLQMMRPYCWQTWSTRRDHVARMDDQRRSAVFCKHSRQPSVRTLEESFRYSMYLFGQFTCILQRIDLAYIHSPSSAVRELKSIFCVAHSGSRPPTTAPTSPGLACCQSHYPGWRYLSSMLSSALQCKVEEALKPIRSSIVKLYSIGN